MVYVILTHCLSVISRYALICQQCFSHNGMALKEEFEYIGNKMHYFLMVLSQYTDTLRFISHVIHGGPLLMKATDIILHVHTVKP